MNILEKVNILLGPSVLESLNSYVQLTHSEGKNRYYTTFEVNGIPYRFEAIYVKGDDEWVVAFGQLDTYGITTHMTNDMGSSALVVFSAVKDSLDALIRHRKPNIISFTASTSEPSRMRLYDRFARQLAHSNQMSLHVNNTSVYREYYLRKKTADESLKRPNYDSRYYESIQEYYR